MVRYPDDDADDWTPASLPYLRAFALIYAADRGVAYAPSVRFGEGDLLDAMSVSGDESDDRRLRRRGRSDRRAGLSMVLEAASGLALIISAITYLLSV